MTNAMAKSFCHHREQYPARVLPRFLLKNGGSAQRLLRRMIMATLAALFCLAGIMKAGAEEKLVVLVSSSDAPFQKALDGFRDSFADRKNKPAYEVVRLEGDAAKAAAAVQKMRSDNTKHVMTIGSLATDAVLQEAADVALVACIVLRTEYLKETPNSTGVGLEFPFEVQFQWLQKLLPDVSTVGVLFSPGENQKRIKAAISAAKKAGIKLEAHEINAPQDVPAALDSLARRVDAVWVIPDSLILSAPIAKNLLLFSFRNNIPLIGPSEAWVKAGALYSLDWSFADLGAQCGEMAQKVLDGAPPSTLPVAAPRKVLYTLNLVTARQLKIDLSEQIVRGARHTY